ELLKKLLLVGVLARREVLDIELLRRAGGLALLADVTPRRGECLRACLLALRELAVDLVDSLPQGLHERLVLAIDRVAEPRQDRLALAAERSRLSPQPHVVARGANPCRTRREPEPPPTAQIPARGEDGAPEPIVGMAPSGVVEEDEGRDGDHEQD